MIDWNQLVAVYAPLLGVLTVMVKMHWDHVYKTIPRALRAIRKESVRARKADTRLLKRIGRIACCRSRVTPRRKTSRGDAAKRRRPSGGSGRRS